MSTNDIEDVYPLSPMQQGMLFYTLYDPQSGAYVEQLRCTLRGNLNVAVFQRAWQHVVDRHPVLRSAYVWKNVDRPLQAVGRNVGVPLEQHDWQGLPAAEQERRLTTFLAGDRARGFKLSQGPLMRLTIFQVAEDAYCVVWSYHHMLLDGWSQQLVMNEVFACYAAFVRGREIQLARPRPYRDYITWLQQQDLAAAEVFWRALLRGFTAATPLVVDRLSRQDDGADGHAEQRLQLAQATASALQALTRRCGLPTNTLVQGAWALLLSRYSGETDVVFGATVSGRPPGLKGMDRMIGLFINTLPVRIRVPSEPPALSWLQQLQAQHVELRQYEYSPLVQVEGWSDVPRGQPLFESIVVFENYPVAAPTLEHDQLSLEISSAAGAGQTNYPLTVIGLPGPRLTIAISYDRRRFDAPTIERMLGHLRTLLESMAARPEQRLGELSLLSDAERGELLRLWKVPQPQHWHELCIHQLFEAQVERTPDAIAVIFDGRGDKETRPAPSGNEGRQGDKETRGQESGVRSQESEFLARNPSPPPALRLSPTPLPPPAGGGTEGGRRWASAALSPQSHALSASEGSVLSPEHLTYQELNRRANRVAHHLRALGVGPEVRVGICAERSPELIVGLLGILKAGGAYVPLDPAYPQERLAFMLADAQVAVLLTQKSIYDLRFTIYDLEESASAIVNRKSKIVNLDADWPTIAAAPPSDSPCPAGPEQLAYVIYTSGSTGRPKGVMVKQRSLINLCFGLRAFFDDPAVSTTGLITSISFDISVNQIFPTLLFGRALHIIPDPVKYDSRAMARYLDRNQVDLLDSVPSYLNAMLTEMHPERLANTLKYILVGGEKLERRLLQKVFAQLGERVMIVNIYGLTEITDINSFSVITSRDLDKTLTIGRPLNNNQIYITDRYNNLVPVGVTGELCIAGESLSRGYLNRPELTAERFVPNPFTDFGLPILDFGLGANDDPIQNPKSKIQNGTRLYRTGDLGRRLADGTIELFGRIDHQVKVHGFRIEVGEIEALLDRHPAVRENVVVVREDAPGERRLVAYVVQGSGVRGQGSGAGDQDILHSAFCILHSDELRAFLQTKLPDYMVPAAFVVLEGLPHTPNGKIDRKALPAPDRYRTGMEGALAAARTPAEELLVGIWADVLHVERVGIHDSFFELGGHSLLATQIVSRVQAAFGVELSLRSLFETPTVAGLAEQVGAVRRDAPELLAPRRRSIPPAALPLSFAQQRLWLLDQFEPDNPAYIIPAAARLRGRLDLDAWARSLNEIVRRHAALRTSFGVRDGQPVQMIAPALTLRVPLLDLRGLAEAEQAAAVERLTAAEAQRPFDLACGPLLRVRLLRLDAEEHLLLLTMHHIISDGWSLNVFVEELAALYRAYLAGASSPLPPLPVQYADYALWQRAWLQGSGVRGQGSGVGGQPNKETRRHGDTETRSTGPQHPPPTTHHPPPNTHPPSPIPHPPSPIQAQLAYWKQQLAGAPPLLDLPTDRTRAALRTFRGATQTFALARELSEALRGMSRREAVTPFMTLLAAFTVLLHRYTGQEDIVVGTPIAGRTRVEIEKLIGFFLNTLVLRMDLAGQPSFRELLRRVREVCLGAYAHQDLPFERLLEELQPERDLSHTPLFQVFFNMVNLPNNRVELPGLSLEILAPPDMGAKFDLTLYVEEKDLRFEFNLVYNADLFEPNQMRELLEQLHHLLLQIVEHPQESIDRFSLVGHTARTRLPDPTEALDSTWQAAVHTALSRQARRVPGRLAVVDPHESWTYAELDARSNQLANYLIEHGIRREQVVAIYAHRSAALVWALIGVLKAGASFVILDPAYPAARLISYLQIAQPRAWLQIEAAGPLPDQLEEFVAAMPWCCRCVLPGYAAAVARGLLTDYSGDDPGVEVGPDDLACVGFTSGSTGKPKGILGRHGPLTHFMPWQAATFGLAESDRFSMLSGIAHDPLQRDIFTPLWLGALICIPDPQDMRVPDRLVAWMQQAEISIAHLTPALGQVLTETTPGMTTELRSLRYAFIVGDVLTRHDVSRIRALAPAVTCVNFYGATETQRAVGYYIIPNDGARDQEQTRLKEVLPLGRGMRDAQLLVLNAAGQLAGIGEVGEIYVRSPHLARGYLGDEALTAVRFIPDPFAGVTGDGCWVLEDSAPNTQHPSPIPRLYKTGDLGRYMPDGNVEFFGRADQQVKIRGFRVELGEIESVLGQHPSVREAVVMAREDAPGDKRLVAYVVQGSGVRGQGSDRTGSDTLIPDPRSLTPEWRGFLKQRLPAYMIPATFVALDALPLTPNGKVDRGALPRPDSRGHDSEATYVAPQTDMERIIAAVWREVLRVEAVGVHDNFFDLGGSSIHIVQLHGKLRAVLDREVPILEMFNYPTVGSLARYISREQHAATPSQGNQDRIQKQKAAMKRQRQQRPR